MSYIGNIITGIAIVSTGTGIIIKDTLKGGILGGAGGVLFGVYDIYHYQTNTLQGRAQNFLEQALVVIPEVQEHIFARDAENIGKHALTGLQIGAASGFCYGILDALTHDYSDLYSTTES